MKNKLVLLLPGVEPGLLDSKSKVLNHYTIGATETLKSKRFVAQLVRICKLVEGIMRLDNFYRFNVNFYAISMYLCGNMPESVKKLLLAHLLACLLLFTVTLRLRDAMLKSNKKDTT